MRQRIVCFAVLVAVAAVLLAAGSAQATTIGYLRPSGDGDNCNGVTNSPTNCVGFIGPALDCGNNGSLCPEGVYNLFQVAVTPGEIVDFTFSSGATDFQVVACGYGTGGNLNPSIYTSNDFDLQLPCTALGDPNDPAAFMNPGNFITDLTGTSNCTTPNTVCYQFSGTGLPSTWVFAELSTAASVVSITSGTVATPEPASLTLLAAGLVGLGAWRRKRAA